MSFDEASGRRSRVVAAVLAEAEEIELRVEKLVAGGEGFGRFRGIPVFVARSAPGDVLRVRLVERKPHFGRAEILEVLAPGPGRTTPRCRHFGDCGGCDLQHLESGVQTDLKIDATREVLRRLGRLELPAKQKVVAGDSWGYRLRTQLHLEGGSDRPRVGYFARRSHRLVEIEECPILLPKLEAFVCSLSSMLGQEVPRRLDVAVGDDGRATCAPALAGLPRGQVVSAPDGYERVFDARTFFQSHRGLLPALIDAVVGGEEGELACDLYAGVGLFSIPLAERYRRVVAVEGAGIAARYLRMNARRAQLDAIEVVSSAVESWLPQLPKAADRVIVDPPRTGLSRRVVRHLLHARPTVVTYVSCHSATLARDLRRFGSDYCLEELVFVDLFPQTGHLETVACLRRREQGR